MRIRIEKASFFRRVEPAFKIIKFRFLIEDITTISERIANTERTGKRAGGAQRLTPCIILVFYNKVVIVVKNSNDISLEILDVSIDCAIESHLRWTGPRILEEVQLIGMLDLVKISVHDIHMRE